MELHRLKPMQTGYDEDLFNELYEKTKYLRKSLVYQIDTRRFGVTQEEVYSWFDDKFIYVFNKYYGEKKPDILLGFLINSLKQFKNRVLRKAYQEGIYANVIRWDETELINIISDEREPEDRTVLVDLINEFFKKRLTHEAYLIFSVELNPPPYIIDKVAHSNSKIPAWLIADYLGWPDTKYTLKLINKFRKEVEKVTLEAKAYFQTLPV